MARSAKQRSETAGRLAEWMAAAWLILQGYRILARRDRSAGSEIDLIARRGNVLAFIEVKARPTLALARASIAARQRRAITAAATAWCARRRWADATVWRYDAVLIAPWRWPRHIRDAWRPDQDPMLERGSRRQARR